MSQNKTLPITVLVAIIVAGLLTWGMIKADRNLDEQERRHYEENIKPDIDRCRALGKYPVLSKWDGELKDCKDF